MQPVVGYSRWRLIYLMAMMTVMSYFLMNLFVGVIVDNFSRHKQEHGGESVTLTKTQQRWVAKVGKKYAKILKKVKSAKAKAKEKKLAAKMLHPDI